MPYSVLMSVYKNDNCKYLEESIKSILNQTVMTNDFVIIKDGPLTEELDNVLEKYSRKYDFINIIELNNNVGLGKALSIGLVKCKNDLVARMDSDDISLPNRLEKQLKFLEENKTVDIVGTQVIEFIDDINHPIQYNNFPTIHEDIVKCAHTRNPYSHPSVVFKKNKVLKAGNYQSVYLCEDYDLWIRMIQNNSKCANLDEYLIAMRISKDYYKRRSGLKYVKSINSLMKKHLHTNFFTKKEYIKNVIIRTIVYLMPNFLRTTIYSIFLRNKYKNA